MAVIECKRGRVAEAKCSLARASSLGARVEQAWLDAELLASSETPKIESAEEAPTAQHNSQESHVERDRKT
jgi:hypothetical protein